MLRLLLIEMKRLWLGFLRYPTEAFASLFSFAILFFAILQGIEHAGGGGLAFGGGLEGLMVSLVLWYLAVIALGSLGWGIQTEAQIGTFEQLCLSPYGPVRILLARVLTSATLNLTLTLLLFTLLVLSTGRPLQLRPEILLGALPFLLAVNGLGFILAGLALFYKNITGLINISQYIVILAIAIPSEAWPDPLQRFSFLFPIVPSADLLRSIMALNVPSPEISWILAWSNGLFYLFIGLSFYQWMDRQVRKLGKLGTY